MAQYKIKEGISYKAFKHQCDDVMQEIVKKSSQPIHNLQECLFTLYIELFKCIPHKIELDYDGIYLNKEYEEDICKKNRFDCIKDDKVIDCKGEIIHLMDDEDMPPRSALKNINENHYTFHSKDILDITTEVNIIENYPGNNLAVYRYDEHPIIIMGDLKTIMFKRENYLAILTNTSEIPEYIKNQVVVEEDDEEQPYFDYVVYDNHGFNTTELPVKSKVVDLNLNYNDDLPHKHIVDFINNADSGLCILHGVPGSGKTTYIRHLMKECKDANFMILNASCFDAINDTSFVNLIIRNQGSTIILEDCEDMLSERMNGNSRIATLLNLSDGILGDALRLKFICTFNAKIGKIDPAILRKGRTHVKYEFKELSKDKAEKLAETLGIVLPEKKSNNIGYSLAEIYNADNNQVDTKMSNKVGFKQ